MQTPHKLLPMPVVPLPPLSKATWKLNKKHLEFFGGIEHFHLYIYGSHFTLITDHKPLKIIYGNINSKPSALIERWVLCLQPYSFLVVYKPGKDNPADFV